jgi:hypothetical protein
MANFVWTGCLYFSTFVIVLVIYRAFINDKKQEKEKRTEMLIKQAKSLASGGHDVIR